MKKRVKLTKIGSEKQFKASEKEEKLQKLAKLLDELPYSSDILEVKYEIIEILADFGVHFMPTPLDWTHLNQNIGQAVAVFTKNNDRLVFFATIDDTDYVNDLIFLVPIGSETLHKCSYHDYNFYDRRGYKMLMLSKI